MYLLNVAAYLPLITGVFSQSWQSWEQPKSNILFIFTDDQDLELGSLNYLPSVVSRVKNLGKESHDTNKQYLMD
jgi:hypothetical protein